MSAADDRSNRNRALAIFSLIAAGVAAPGSAAATAKTFEQRVDAVRERLQERGPQAGKPGGGSPLLQFAWDKSTWWGDGWGKSGR